LKLDRAQCSEDALRLIAKHETRGLHRVTADVEQRTAAVLGDIARVRRICIEVAEKAGRRAELADAAGADEFARAQPLRVRAHHEGFANLDAVFITGFAQAASLRGIATDGFFAEDMLDAAGGANGPLDVEMIGERIVDGLDLSIVEELFVGAVGFGMENCAATFFAFSMEREAMAVISAIRTVAWRG